MRRFVEAACASFGAFAVLFSLAALIVGGVRVWVELVGWFMIGLFAVGVLCLVLCLGLGMSWRSK